MSFGLQASPALPLLAVVVALFFAYSNFKALRQVGGALEGRPQFSFVGEEHDHTALLGLLA